MEFPAANQLPTSLEKSEVIALREKHLCSSLKPSFNQPLLLVKGEKQYLYDEKGTKYLDAYNNVAHVGHCHPHVVKAVTEQVSNLNTNTRYLHQNLALLAKKLTSTMPESLSVCFFVNSGSEANDLAVRLARYYTQRMKVIHIENSYHGTTALCAKLSSNVRYIGTMAAENKIMVPIPDTYRGIYKKTDSNPGLKYAQTVKACLDDHAQKKDPIAAFIVESLQGVGGQIPYPEGYLKHVFEYVREAGGLCIADEVQTGLGRVGSHFWGFQTQDVLPDIVTMGKAFGNGMPLAAVVTTPQIAEAFSKQEYFNTFGGNPVSCAAGLAVIETVLSENLQQNALVVGTYLKSQLQILQKKYPVVIGDVRGQGFFLGIEFVKCPKTIEPNAELAKKVCNELKDVYHILTGTDGPHHNVIKIKPPMCFNKENADYLVASIDAVLAQHQLKSKL